MILSDPCPDSAPAPRFPTLFGPASLLALTAGAHAQLEVQHVVDLGTLGGTFSYATDINDAGMITGTGLTTSGELHPFLWVPDTQDPTQGTMIDLGLPPGYYRGVSRDVNALGQVVGRISSTQGWSDSAFVWTPTDPQDPTAGGNYEVLTALNEARAINDLGVVAASGEDGTYLWTALDGPSLPGTLIITPGRAWDITSRGDVVGRSLGGSFLWFDSTTMTVAAPRSSAHGANVHRQVVGWFTSSEDPWIDSAYVWTPFDPEDPALGGTFLGLGNPGGGSEALADSINDLGQVVGGSVTLSGDQAWIWSAEEGFTLLPPLPGGSDSWAQDINDNGHVVGQCRDANGEMRPTLWILAPPAPPDPTVAVADLISDVEALVSVAALSPGQANGLIKKLEAVLRKLEAGQPNAAVNILGAFINSVAGFVNGNVLMQGEGDDLTTSANYIISLI